jgi:hypothetical protein
VGDTAERAKVMNTWSAACPQLVGDLAPDSL